MSDEITPKATSRQRERINGFLAYLQTEKNASAHTVLAYKKDLYKFADFLGEENFKAVDHRKIRAFLASLHEHGLQKSSMARTLAGLRSFYRWMGKMGMVEQNPAALVSGPKLPKRLPRVPTAEEINGLLESDIGERAAFPERDRVIFELLYGCGIRNSELVGVALSDIEWTNDAIRVLGKGRKVRLVPLGDAAAEAIRLYQPLRDAVLQKAKQGNSKRIKPGRFKPQNDKLLINLRGGPLTT